MNTFDPPTARARPASAPTFRARGCILTEDPGPSEDLAARKEAAERKELAERERIRRAAEEAAERSMHQQLDAMRQAQQHLWKRFHEELARTFKTIEADIKRQLIEMSIRTTEILLCHQLPDAEMVRSIMAEVLAPISDLQGVRVRVAPGTLAMLTGGADTPRVQPGVECVEDPDLKPGDVVVESRNGIFDGRLRSRLDQLAEALAQPPVDETAED